MYQAVFTSLADDLSAAQRKEENRKGDYPSSNMITSIFAYLVFLAKNDMQGVFVHWNTF